MNDPQSTQQKQKYLREQILQSSYDADQFVNFLFKDLKIKQLDVDNHTMKQLESIVFKFKQYIFYKEEKQPEPQPNDKSKKIKRNKIDYENNGSVFDYEFVQQHECIKNQELANQIQVFITKFQITQSQGIFFSLGSKTQIWFIIKSNLHKEPVKRLENDFQWLSGVISRLYPTIAVPQLITAAKQNVENHEKRRRELQEYIQILAKRQEFRYIQIFYDFLTLPYEKLQKFKKHTDSLAFAKGIQSIQNSTGIVDLTFDNKLRNYIQAIPTYSRKSQTLHENIASSIQRTIDLYNQTNTELNKLVNYYAELHESYNELVQKYPEQKINDYNEVLININNLFHTLSDNVLVNSKILQTNFKEYHKIELNYDKVITKLYRNVNQAEKEYINYKVNLNRKKERIYPDVTKWQVQEKLLDNRRLTMEETFDLMLPKETQQQVKMKRWMAYLYGNFKKEFQKQIQFQVKRYVGVFCTFSSQILLNNKHFVEEITKFIEESHKICSKS